MGFLPFPLPWHYHLLQKTRMATPGTRTPLPSLPWAHEDSRASGFVTENLLKAESEKSNRQKKTDIGYHTAALMKKYFGLRFFSVNTLTSTAIESL